MPEIHDTGTEAPTIKPEDEDFQWEGALEEEEVVELPAELLTEVADKLGLVEDDAEALGEEKLRAMLKKIEPAEAKPPPKPVARPKKSKGTVKDVAISEGYDDALVKELQYGRTLTKQLLERLDGMDALRETSEMDDLRVSLKEAAKDFPNISRADIQNAEDVMAAMKKGYGDTVPPNEQLAEMALRSVGGAPSSADRSDQFTQRPTHRNTKGGSSKETPRDRAIRNVARIMDEAEK